MSSRTARPVPAELVPLGLLRGGVPGGQGESDDVGARPSTTGGDCFDEPTRRLWKDRQVGNYTAQRREPTDVRRRVPPFPDPSPHVLLTEANHHPGSGQGLLGHCRRDHVVEDAIQVRYRGIQEDPGNGVGDAGRRDPAFTGLGQVQQLTLRARAATTRESGWLCGGGSVVVAGCHIEALGRFLHEYRGLRRPGAAPRRGRWPPM